MATGVAEVARVLAERAAAMRPVLWARVPAVQARPNTSCRLFSVSCPCRALWVASNPAASAAGRGEMAEEAAAHRTVAARRTVIPERGMEAQAVAPQVLPRESNRRSGVPR